MSVVDFPPKKLHLIFYRLTRDPYEHTRVYVSQSRIPYAGEGLFAKQRVEAGSLLAIFNGVRIRDNSRAASTRNKKRQKHNNHNIWSDSEAEPGTLQRSGRL